MADRRRRAHRLTLDVRPCGQGEGFDVDAECACGWAWLGWSHGAVTGTSDGAERWETHLEVSRVPNPVPVTP